MISSFYLIFYFLNYPYYYKYVSIAFGINSLFYFIMTINFLFLYINFFNLQDFIVSSYIIFLFGIFIIKNLKNNNLKNLLCYSEEKNIKSADSIDKIVFRII